MALPRSNLIVPLGVGLNTEVDDKLVAPGSVLELENYYCDKTGRIRRRAGSEVASRPAPTTVPLGGTLPDVWQLASFKDKLVRLGLQGDNAIATLVDDDRYAIPGATGSSLATQARGPVTADTIPVVQDASIANVSWVPDGGLVDHRYFVTAIEQHNAAGITVVRVEIYDTETGQNITSSTTGVGCVRPRVCVTGTVATVVYIDQTLGRVTADCYNLANLEITGAPTSFTIYASLPSQLLIDTKRADGGVNGTVWIAYVNAAGHARVSLFNPLVGVVNDAAVLDTSSAAVDPTLLMAWQLDLAETGRHGLAVADATNGLRMLWDLPAPNTPTITAVATHVLDNSTEAKRYPLLFGAEGIYNVTSFTTGTGAGGDYWALYDIFRLNRENNAAVWRAQHASGGGQSNQIVFRGVTMRTHAFKRDGDYYITTSYLKANVVTAYQGTYFVMRIPPTEGPELPLAIYARWTAGGKTERANSLGHMSQLGERWLAAVTETVAIIDGAAVRGTSISNVEFLEAPETSLSAPIQFLDWLIVPGGTTMIFDGRNYVEMTFANRPETPTLAATAGAGMEVGEHGYQMCYAWPDAAGRIWRSDASVLGSVTTTGPNAQVTVTFDYLHVTGRRNVMVEIYRARTGTSETYNRVTTIANDTATMTGTFVDTLADASIASNLELYTDGGGLGNQTVAGFKLLAVYDGRLWGVTFEDPETLWYSNQPAFGEGLLWNEVFAEDIVDQRGALRAIASLDDRIVSWKGDGVYMTTGHGADSQGIGATYETALVAGGVGCVNPKSVIVNKDGAWFFSSAERAGWHTVTRGMAVEYTGKGVRSYDSETVVSGVLLSSSSQMRWFTASGRTLVWDWVSGMWSTNTEQAAISACVVDGVQYYAAGAESVLDGCVLREAAGVYSEGRRDDGVYVTYPMRAVTPWLIMANLQGFIRVLRCQGTGDNAGAHLLAANLFRNYDDTDAVGAYVKSFADGDPWTWELRPRVQKLGAMKLELVAYDESMLVAPSEGPIIEAAVFVLGVKKGLRKQANSARMTPT